MLIGEVCCGCIPIKTGLQAASLLEILFATFELNQAFILSVSQRKAHLGHWISACIGINLAIVHAYWLSDDCRQSRKYRLWAVMFEGLFGLIWFIFGLILVFRSTDYDIMYSSAVVTALAFDILLYNLYQRRVMNRYQDLHGDFI